MNVYKAFYNGHEREIMASDLYSAKIAAMHYLRVPLSKKGLLAIVLVEKDGAAVEINPASL